MLFSTSFARLSPSRIVCFLALLFSALFLIRQPLQSQNCSGGAPVIFEVYSSLGRNGAGCANGGAGTRVRIVGCNLQDARVFVAPIGRPPEEASEQTQIVSRSQSQIELDIGNAPDNSVIEVRRYVGASYLSDSRCFAALVNVGSPLIYDFEPKQVPVGRPTLVYIYGGEFRQEVEVTINGESYRPIYRAQGIDIESNPPRALDTLVIEVSTCQTGNIVVRNTRTNRSSTSLVPLTCIQPIAPTPTITNFGPRRGGRGTLVTIEGTNLDYVNRVRIGRTVAEIVSRNGSTSIVVRLAGGSTGKIELSSPNGTVTSIDDFTYVPAPTITDFSPRTIGPGTPVIIYGSNLREASVFFGATDDRSVVPISGRVNNDGTELTVQIGTIGTITNVFPALPVFRELVRVRTPGGNVTARQTVEIRADTFRLPMLSLRPANARNGAQIDAERNQLLLRERVASYFPPKEAQGGEILIERRGWNSNLNVIVRLTYRDSSGKELTQVRGFFLNDLSLPPDPPRPIIPLPIPPIARGENIQLLPNFPARSEEAADGGTIDGLRGDLGASARTRGQDLMVQGTNVIPMPFPMIDGFTLYDSVSMSFRARWSDQSYITNPENMPQSSARQGRRTLTIELLDPLNPGSYGINVLARTATVVLDDPDPLASVRVVNPIPNKMIAPGANEIILLDERGNSPNPLNGGNYLPKSVFFDETYTPLTYTVQTSDPSSILGLKIEQVPNSTPAQYRLVYQLAPTARAGTSAMITVTAQNGRGGSTTHTFSVSVLQGAPIIERVEPNAAAPGAEVRIIGRDLANLRSVAFAGIGTTATAEIVSTSADVIVVRVPNTAQTGAITVTTREAASQTQTFTVIRTPQIRSFSPTSGVSGTAIEIRGINFNGVNAVSFGGVNALDFTVLSDTVIRARVRNGATGVISIANIRETAQSQAVFTLIAPPIISAVSPQTGGAGTEVALTGENFTGSSFTAPDTVLLNNRPVSITLTSASRLTFTVPDFGLLPLENLTIRMVTRGGSTTATTTFSFTPCPRLETVIPTSAGPLDSISLFGTNLSGVVQVSIGGVAVRGFRVVSPSEIRVAVGSVNTGRVRVAAAMCSDSSSTNFTYNAPARPLLITLPRFGKVFPNGITTSSVTLMNLGNTPLTLTLGITQDTESNFSITAPTQAITLQRNEIAQATVRFSPKTSGWKTARISATGNGLAAPQDTGISAQAGVWQVVATDFDTVRVGRNTVRAARIINRNTIASSLDVVRLVGDNGFSIIGTLPRWVGAGDTVAAIVRALPNSTRLMQANILAESRSLDTGSAQIRAVSREQRITDIVVESSFAAERDSVEAGQNVALRVNLRITQNATAFPNAAQVRGSVRWNRNVLLPQLNAGSPAPAAQGTMRLVGNTESRNSTLRAELPPQTPHQSWTGTNSLLLFSLPLGVYYGETNISPLEIEELFVSDASGSPGASTRRVFVEEPQSSIFTAKTFGRRVRASNSSSLDVISPSPTTVSANVRYTIAAETAILLTLVDVGGKRVKTIAEGWRGVGVYEHTFDVSEIPSGSYYVMLHTERERATAALKIVR